MPAKTKSKSKTPSKAATASSKTKTSTRALFASTDDAYNDPDSLSHVSHPADKDGYPTHAQYKAMERAYLLSITPRKRDKALITQAQFDKIWDLLHDPAARIGSAQYRFWVRKMFTLRTPDADAVEAQDEAGDVPDALVLHNARPVAIAEQMYDVLCFCHGRAGHAGRDKTTAVVRDYYSWVPKDLIARFVRACPTCDHVRDRSRTPYDYAKDEEMLEPEPLEEEDGDEQAVAGPRHATISELLAQGEHSGSMDSPGDASWQSVGGPFDHDMESAVPSSSFMPESAERSLMPESSAEMDTAGVSTIDPALLAALGQENHQSRSRSCSEQSSTSKSSIRPPPLVLGDASNHSPARQNALTPGGFHQGEFVVEAPALTPDVGTGSSTSSSLFSRFASNKTNDALVPDTPTAQAFVAVDKDDEHAPNELEDEEDMEM